MCNDSIAGLAGAAANAAQPLQKKIIIITYWHYLCVPNASPLAKSVPLKLYSGRVKFEPKIQCFGRGALCHTMCALEMILTIVGNACSIY